MLQLFSLKIIKLGTIKYNLPIWVYTCSIGYQAQNNVSIINRLKQKWIPFLEINRRCQTTFSPKIPEKNHSIYTFWLELKVFSMTLSKNDAVEICWFMLIWLFFSSTYRGSLFNISLNKRFLPKFVYMFESSLYNTGIDQPGERCSIFKCAKKIVVILFYWAVVVFSELSSIEFLLLLFGYLYKI